MGLSRSDYDDDEDSLPEVEMSEDMAASWELFMALSTQWRYTNGQPTGLDYNTFPIVAKLYKIEDEETAFEDVRICERHTLNIVHKK